jgi:hypothetical protein
MAKADPNELVVIAASGKGQVYHRSSEEEDGQGRQFRKRWSACGAVENGTRWTLGYVEENGFKPCSKPQCYPDG